MKNDFDLLLNNFSEQFPNFSNELVRIENADYCFEITRDAEKTAYLKECFTKFFNDHNIIELTPTIINFIIVLSKI